jgi:hypothetical protein
MNDFQCMIQGCQAKVYSPAGTQHVCKEHFLSFLTWRRRKGAQMFVHYAGLSMDQRDPIAAEWSKTVSTVLPHHARYASPSSPLGTHIRRLVHPMTALP